MENGSPPLTTGEEPTGLPQAATQCEKKKTPRAQKAEKRYGKKK